MKNKLMIILCLMLSAVILFSACRKENPQKTKEPLSSVNNTQQTTTTSPSDTTETTTTSTTTPQQTTTTKGDTSITTTTPKVTTTQPKKTTVKTTAKTTAKTTTTPQQTTPPANQLIVPNASQIEIIENEIVRLVNEYRVQNGVAKLTVEPKLTQGARIRAKECSTTGNFGHERPDGSSGISVLTDVKYGTLNTFQEYVDGEWVDRAEYGAGPAAENLTGFTNTFFGIDYYNCTNTELKMVAQEMFDGWKASPGHNKNMLNNNYKKFGMGIFSEKKAMTNGETAVFFYGIQLFTAE